MRRYFRWQFRIAELFSVNIHDSELRAMFHLNFAKFMQVRLPKTVVRKVVGDAF